MPRVHMCTICGLKTFDFDEQTLHLISQHGYDYLSAVVGQGTYSYELSDAAKPRRKRGPKQIHTPLERRHIAENWLRVQFDMTQEDYCNDLAISVSQLKKYLREL